MANCVNNSLYTLVTRKLSPLASQRHTWPSWIIFTAISNQTTHRRLIGQISGDQFRETRGRTAHANVESSKQSVRSADFVKSHFVDQPLKDERIVGEQVHAPPPA